MLKVFLKKTSILKKLNDELTGQFLLKKKIQSFLKKLLLKKKKQILYKYYGFSQLRFNKNFFKLIYSGIFYKHFFFNVWWAKLLYFNFLKKKNDTKILKRRYKMVFFHKEKKLYLLKWYKKKKLWYFPLFRHYYLKKHKKKIKISEVIQILRKQSGSLRYYFKYFKKFLLYLYITFRKLYKFFLNEKIIKFNKKYSLKKKKIKFKNLKKYFKIFFAFPFKNLKKKIIFLKYKKLVSIINFYKYKKILNKIFWQINIKKFLKNWFYLKKHWAFLKFSKNVYKKPKKKIKIFNKKIYFLKSLYIFWGFFIFFNKKPLNILYNKKLFLKFRNFCNVYRINFYNIIMLRLGSILLNSNFIHNSYYLKHIIKKGFILLNKALNFSLNIICKKWDFITVLDIYKYYLFKFIKEKFKYITKPKTFMLRGGFWISKYNKPLFSWNKKIFHNVPRYLYIDYRLLIIIVLKINFNNLTLKPIFTLALNKTYIKKNYFSWFKL